jgi:4-amino-4-deoxy-L-arabinose transferase-like glycosyltransferase
MPLGWLASGTGVFLGIAGLALGLGRIICGHLLDDCGSAARLWLSVTTGLAAMTALVFAIGAIKCFSVPVTTVCLGLAAAVVTVVMSKRRDWLHQIGSDLRAANSDAARDAPWIWPGIAIIGLVAMGAALAPEVRGDSLIYHISAAMLFVVHAGHVEIPSSALTYIPQNQQLLYALALLFDGDTAARLLHLLCGVLLVAGTVASARLLGMSRCDAMVSALLLLTVPTWIYLATSTYVDLAVANYSLACLYCLLVARRNGSTAWTVLAAMMAGMAMGCKYTAGVVLTAPAMILAAAPARGATGAGAAVRRAMLFATLSFLVLAPWLIRNFIWTGNPVAPSLMGLLGPPGVPTSTVNWPDVQPGNPALFLRPLALLASVAQMYISFLDYGNFLPVLTPLAWVLALAGSQARRAAGPAEMRLIISFLVLALVLGVPLGAVRRDSRYVMAHFAVAAVLTVFWWRHAVDTWPRHARLLQRAGASLLAILIALWALRSWVWFRDLKETVLPPKWNETRAAYLRARIPHYDALVALSGQIRPEHGRVLGASYPSRVPYVLGGAPLTADLRVQQPEHVKPEHIAGLRRQNVRYLFGRIRDDLRPFVEEQGEFGGVTLWRLLD